MRKNVMLCYPFEERRLLKWEPPYICQPKLDGERCRALVSFYGTVTLFSSEENVITSVPHINKAISRALRYNDVELDGELYIHGASFEEIHSIVGRTVNLSPDHREVKLYVFDLVSDQPQAKRFNELNKIEFPPELVRVPTILAWNLEEIMRLNDRYLNEGYEGIVVRHFEAPYIRRRSTFMMKFKPKRSDIYQVVGFKEEIDKNGKPKGRLGALVCQGGDGTQFSVGSGLTEEQRVNLWLTRDSLTEHDVKVAYQHLTSLQGVPRFPVFVELVERPQEVEFVNPLV
ncbi:MAG: hypothetical protein KKD77_21000 [Gammaproteobacteria bacterium]|nr:hypothetical protein [Gammaproteobacteria bacterium]